MRHQDVIEVLSDSGVSLLFSRAVNDKDYYILMVLPLL